MYCILQQIVERSIFVFVFGEEYPRIALNDMTDNKRKIPYIVYIFYKNIFFFVRNLYLISHIIKNNILLILLKYKIMLIILLICIFVLLLINLKNGKIKTFFIFIFTFNISFFNLYLNL